MANDKHTKDLGFSLFRKLKKRFKNRKKNKAEATQIFEKLNKRGQLEKTEKSSFFDFTSKPGQVRKDRAFKRVLKQVRKTRNK